MLQPKKHQRTRNIDIFAKNLSFLRSKAFYRVTLQKLSRTYTNDSPQKMCKLKLFANHDPSERHFWSKWTCHRHAISPHPDQLETCGLDHWHCQHLHSLLTRIRPSQTSPREKGTNHSTPFPPTVALLEYSFSYIALLHSSKR